MTVSQLPLVEIIILAIIFAVSIVAIRVAVPAYDYCDDVGLLGVALRTIIGRPSSILPSSVVNSFVATSAVSNSAAGRSVRPTRASRVSEVGQRTGVHREARAAVVGARGRPDALHRARQSLRERLQRELQRQAQGRAVERGDLLLVGGGGRAGRAMEARVQYRPTPQRLRRLSPGP